MKSWTKIIFALLLFGFVLPAGAANAADNKLNLSDKDRLTGDELRASIPSRSKGQVEAACGW